MVLEVHDGMESPDDFESIVSRAEKDHVPTLRVALESGDLVLLVVDQESHAGDFMEPWRRPAR